MKKILLIIPAFLLSVVFSLSIGVGAFSADNIANRITGREEKTYTPEEGLSIEADEEYSVLIEDVDSYVNNIKFTFDGAQSPAEATVYFTVGEDEDFSEENSASLAFGAKNDDMYLSLEKEVDSVLVVYDAALDKNTNTRAISAPTGVTLNPRGLHVNVFLTLLLLVAPFLILWALIEILFDRKDFKRDLSSLKRYKYLLFDLVTRDLKTKYRRSVLGILWSILNPLLMMLVLTAVFSNIMRVQVEGGFALFYLTGYIMFNFVSESTNTSLMSVFYASGLIKKVYIPKYIFPLEKCIFSFVNMLFTLIAFVIVFCVFVILGKNDPSFTMLLFPVPMIYLFVFSFGLSLVLAAVYIFFRDIGHIYSVLLTVWMYASPVIYPPSILPDWLGSLMKLNPLYHYITYFRNIMLYGTLPSLTDNLVCILFAVAALAFGVTVFRKAQDKFILYI